MSGRLLYQEEVHMLIIIVGEDTGTGTGRESVTEAFVRALTGLACIRITPKAFDGPTGAHSGQYRRWHRTAEEVAHDGLRIVDTHRH